MALFDLGGRLALITGSSKGIGYALARGLAGQGAIVVLNGRDERALLAARDRLAGEGHDVRVAPFDATDPVAVTAAVERVETDHGPIDILINNAGMQHRTPLEDFPLEAWHKLLATNVTSMFLVGRRSGAA